MSDTNNTNNNNTNNSYFSSKNSNSDSKATSNNNLSSNLTPTYTANYNYPQYNNNSNTNNSGSVSNNSSSSLYPQSGIPPQYNYSMNNNNLNNRNQPNYQNANINSNTNMNGMSLPVYHHYQMPQYALQQSYNNQNNNYSQSQPMNSYSNNGSSKLLPYSQFLKGKQQQPSSMENAPNQYQSTTSLQPKNYREGGVETIPLNINKNNNEQIVNKQLKPLSTYADFMMQNNPKVNSINTANNYETSPTKKQQSKPNQYNQQGVPNKNYSPAKNYSPNKQFQKRQSQLQRQSSKLNLHNSNHNTKTNNNHNSKAKHSSKSYNNQPNQMEYDYDSFSSNSHDQFSDGQDQEIFYTRPKKSYHQDSYNKHKSISKPRKTNTGIGMDSPQEIRKWIQARKKNYPSFRKKAEKQEQAKKQSQTPSSMMSMQEKKQLSQLEQKIRKKINIINGDSRGNILKKIKNIDLLRRIIQHPEKILTDKNKRKQFQRKSENERNINRDNIDNRTNPLRKEDLQAVKQTQKEELTNKQQKQELIEVQQQQQGEIDQPKEKKVIQASENESEQSHQPIQMPATKIIQPMQEQIEVKQRIGVKRVPDMFQFIQKSQKPINLNLNKQSNNASDKMKEYPTKPRNQQNPRTQLDPQKIIEHLRQKQLQDKQSLDTLFDYKSNSYNYRYRVQTLQTNLKLEDIFTQTSYLLQSIRYIVKESNDFFDKQVK